MLNKLICLFALTLGACTSQVTEMESNATVIDKDGGIEDPSMPASGSWCEGENLCKSIFDYACQCERIYCSPSAYCSCELKSWCMWYGSRCVCDPSDGL